MAEIVVLDAGPLGMISHATPSLDIMAWFARLVVAGRVVCIPEIADYEVRRELLRAGKTKGLKRLDELKSSLKYFPITTEAMLKAAEFWADARKVGRPTGHEHSLDADSILAAQVATCSTRFVVVATTNPKHLARFVPAELWENIA
jgi:predicted nucleic acid-binding protein